MSFPVAALPFFTIMNWLNDSKLYAKLANCFHKEIGSGVETDDIVLVICICHNQRRGIRGWKLHGNS